MRIGLFIERFDVSRGGRERSTAEIARRLALAGHEVEVVCIAARPPADAPYAVQTMGRRPRLRATALARFVAAAQERIRTGRYDVTHAMFPLPDADVYQLRGGTLPGLRTAHLRRLRQPWRASRQALWALNRPRALLGRLEARVMADPRTWCLPVSGMVAREIEEHYGRTRRVRVVYNGVDVEAATSGDPDRRREVRRQWGLGPDGFVMFCPATNYALKGVLEAAKAYARFHRRDPRGPSSFLVVAGSEEDHGYRHVVASMGVGGYVRFVRPVTDMSGAYAAADAVVLLSWYDPCSRVVLEAVSVGLPSITTRYNGASEILGEGAGIVVDDPRRRDAVADAMGELADPDRRAEYARACRRLAPRVSMARHVEEVLSVYEDVARQ